MSLASSLCCPQKTKRRACSSVPVCRLPPYRIHLGQFSTVPNHWIPIFYAVAMGVDALAALLAGGLYDRKGVVILAVTVLV
jgi:hypothetical protein